MQTRLRPLFLAIAALAFAAAAPAQSPSTPAPPPAVVDVAPAVKVDFAPLHWAPASVASREDARVAAETGGRVVSVAEVGTVLRRGDVLARLDDASLQLDERHAAAELARLVAQVDYARRQEQRYTALVRDAGISGAQLDQAIAERRVREQDAAAARVVLEQVRLRRRQAQVLAPFDGVVVERLVERGEFLSAGAPVARLVNTSALEVRARAPVALVGHLREGVGVTLRHDGVATGHLLATVVPVGDEVSRQVELRFPLDPDVAAAGGLAVGSAVELGVPRDPPRQVLAVPVDALVMRGDGSHVVRVGEGGQAERIAVEPGAVLDGLVEITGEVRAGDRLVVRGAERLQPGQRLSITPRPGRPLATLAGRQP